ncbi:M16 family metallopeptidase [Patescibacteria group bacterium]
MYKKTTLKNGLRILTSPMEGTKTVSVLVLVKTGSKYETKDINGLSHFLEHIFFKGTRKRPDTLAISESLDRVGGEYNAFTTQEYTGYWAKVSNNYLDLALDWVSDIFLNSQIKSEEIEKEKGTIIEELNMYLDMPMRYIGDLWMELLYGDQPAGWKVIGTKDNIKNLKREEFIKYLENHYSSKNTVVVIAGNIKNELAIKKAKKYFKTINTKEVKDKLPVKEHQNKPEALIYYKKTDQTYLHLGVRAYDIFHPDKYALGLLGTILGGNMSSRMFISVRERQGLAYYIKTGIYADTDTGSLVTQAGVDNKRVDRAIKSILKEYKKISERKITQSELQKAKDYTKGSALIDMESSDSQASFIGFQELMTNKILTLESKFAKIDAVTINDIQRVAKDIFRPEKLNLALIGPFKNKDRFNKLLKI